MIPDAAIIRLFGQGLSYVQIAERLHLTKGVVAGRCRRLGLVRNPDRTGPRKMPAFEPVRPVISAAEMSERELDQRDIDILYDLQEGHSQGDCSRYWGVSKSHVQKIGAARSAS